MLTRPRRAFTLTEVLITIGVIAALLALLLPALGTVRTRGNMTSSMSNMRQIANAVGTYASDFRDHVLPSQFNHHLDLFIGHPRCMPSLGEWHARGTWADILWTRHEMGFFPDAALAGLGHDYRFDSPDKKLYEYKGAIPNPLRSAQNNSRDVIDGTGPVPYGSGATERAWPGYFAANNFFNDDQVSESYNGAFTMGQIRSPARALYLVDSFAGEIIEDMPDPYDTESDTLQVDFRYAGACLMMFLDGHVDAHEPWGDLDELEETRAVRVRELTRR
jgi:prepilin-type N-terminal cleavage/methylation domain-containing protein